MSKKAHGFTIVELLIVIVVIAILAAISIVAYNGIQQRANDTAVQSDFRQFAKAMELFRIDHPAERYPNTYAEFTASLGLKLTKTAYKTTGTTNAVIYCITTDGSDYILIGLSKSGKSWSIKPRAAPAEYTGAGVASTGYQSQTVVCPAALSNGTTSNNAWAFSGGSWSSWVN